MIGSKQFDISYKDFVKGMNTSDPNTDGGFSSLTTNFSPTLNPGKLTLVDSGSTKTPNNVIIATAPMANAVGAYWAAVDTGGRYYLIDGRLNTLTYKVTDTINDYTNGGGLSSMVAYNVSGTNYIFTSTPRDIAAWAGSTSVTSSWWHTTMSQAYLSQTYRHPLLVLNNLLYIGDRYKLHSVDSNGTIVNSLLTLTSTYVITALGIDPGSGKMMVAITQNPAYSDAVLGNQLNGQAFIGIYDGFNPTQFLKKIPVDQEVDAIYNVGGNCYVTCGNKLYLWTGSGLQFLRRLNVDLDKDTVVTQHKIASNKNTLLIAEDTKVLAYGEVLGKQDKVFYYLDDVSINPIQCIYTPYKDYLSYSYWDATVTDGTIKRIDLATAGTSGTGTFYSLVYQLPRPSNIGQINIYLDGQLSQGSYTVYLLDDQGNTKTVGSLTSSEPVQYKPMGFSAKTSSVQFKVVGVSVDQPLVRLLITYDYAE